MKIYKAPEMEVNNESWYIAVGKVAGKVVRGYGTSFINALNNALQQYEKNN